MDNVSDSDHDTFECWIIDHYYQLCLYIPIGTYMIFAIILTIYSIYRVRKIGKVKSNKDFSKTKRGLLIQRLLAFTIIFLITWIFPLIVRLWPFMFDVKAPPFIFLVLHHASLGCIGLGNSIVWISSSSFPGCNKSLKTIRSEKARARPVEVPIPSYERTTKSKLSPMGRVKKLLTFCG